LRTGWLLTEKDKVIMAS